MIRNYINEIAREDNEIAEKFNLRFPPSNDTADNIKDL